MSDTERTEITKVMMVIREFLNETKNVIHSAEKSQQWIIQFRNTLCYQDLEENPNKFALKLLEEARGFNTKQSLKAKIKNVRRILANEGIANPTKEQINQKWQEVYNDFNDILSATGNDQVQAGAPNGNNGDESTTACVNNPKGSARPSTDGDTRKDSRNITGSSNGASLESATSVENHFANDSDQAASNTGITPPVVSRESGNLSEVTAKKPLAGGMLPSSSLKPPASPGAVDVLSLAYSGEFQNVKLTQEQYSELGIKFGNMQKLNRAIDSLSCKLENEEIKPVPKNHYAVLLKWASYREDMEEKKELEESKPKMTNMEKSWIAAMKRVEEM